VPRGVSADADALGDLIAERARERRAGERRIGQPEPRRVAVRRRCASSPCVVVVVVASRASICAMSWPDNSETARKHDVPSPQAGQVVN
jgi:hypothetical protein